MRARGISQVEVIVVLAVIAALALGALRLAVYSEKVGYDRGKLEGAEQDNKELLAAKKALADLQAEVDIREIEHENATAKIDLDGQRKVKDVEARKDQFVADVVAGRIRLFDPNAGRSCTGEAAAGAPRTATGVDHGTGGGQLRDEASILLFLNAEAARADKIVAKLTAAQQELLADRRACNAPEGR